MYLGIDLGTSNSAIVGNLGTELKIFKTAEGTDVLPSAIFIDKRGHRLIGGRAYDQTVLSPENVAQGFKRLMGTSTLFDFAGSSLTMSPEEASAEIIKTLLNQVHIEAGAVEVHGTVITIPAAFNQMQSEATLRAARMAGIEQVGLLQEPVAAAMAAMVNTKNKNGQFLVYDLGGGTFDVALVQSVGGQVNVIAHEGINMLGGRDFDRVIVNSLIRPWLVDKYRLPVDFQAQPRFRRLIRIAQLRAEQAKIDLSTSEKSILFVSDEDARVVDEAGQDIYIEIAINRSHFEGLIADRITETIVLCRKVIKDHGFTNEDIDRVVFVGGPSKMPWIREQVPVELGIPADLSADPMTAVALGASIFAESRTWHGAESFRKASRGAASVSGAINIRYDYPARTAEDYAKVRLRPEGNCDGNGYRVRVDMATGWTSGMVEVVKGTSIEVPLGVLGENQLRISVFDPFGKVMDAATSTFSITKGHASAAAVPATQTISVKVAEGVLGNERNALEPLIEKGTPLPAKGNTRLRAGRDLKGGEEGEILCELYQQAQGVPEPDLNLPVGEFAIRGNDIEPGQSIRKGEDVIFHWRMDDNGILNVSVEVPSIGQIFNKGNFFASVAGHRNFEGESGQELAAGVLEETAKTLNKAEEVFAAEAQDNIDGLRKMLDEQKTLLNQSDDADARRQVTEQARFIQQELSRLRHSPDHRKTNLLNEMNEALGKFNSLVRTDALPTAIGRMEQLAETTRRACERGDRDSFDDAERAIREMRNILYSILFETPSYLAYLFRSMCEDRYLAVDKNLHNLLIKDGEEAIANDDVRGLRKALGRMMDNRFEVGTNKAIAALAGLMRA
ncbi:MAG TPA: Hsp70 family protein [Acidobacteriaceae bacterium]|jgi:molecular chaperone DnaK|nr:Hsp70 family protein [Acidobacteriaceae bacterium]